MTRATRPRGARRRERCVRDSRDLDVDADAADARRRRRRRDEAGDEVADGEDGEGSEEDALEDLSEETGIDLTDASDLDADNVPADEEFDRVMQAPD